MALPQGAHLGPYELLAPLGAGGMGEVYRARDTRLGREVALKILPENRCSDPDSLRRFEAEARAVASLNHPHILALHDVGTHQGVPYTVTELLEGRTLRHLLDRGPLPPRKVVDYGVQICRGLAAAHGRGVVHRDLKPENLFLTKDGGVKILDFGLAKLSGPPDEPDSPESERRTATEPGLVMGTAGYMSPEQARGRPADPRSDLFALGAVLYEMLAGRRAFSGSTAAETLSAILHDDPPEIASGLALVPAGLERIVRRCLEKRPEDRFDSAHDLALALEAVSFGTSRRFWLSAVRGWRLIGAGALLALGTTAGLWRAWPREPPLPPLRVRPITSSPGYESDPALSPDGHQVAFVRRDQTTLDLYVQLIDGGDPLLLSRGDMDTFAPTWSPDGRQIAFLRHEEGERGEILHAVFVIPALGGPVRRVATSRSYSYGHALAWTPDGRSLLINDKESPDEPEALFALSVESGERRRLTRPPSGCTGDSGPRFSPDGRMVAFIRAKAPWEDDIYVVPAAGGEERRVTVGNRLTLGLAWTPDGHAIVFSSFRVGGASMFCLWRVPTGGGDPQPLSFGENGQAPTVSRDGRRLAYARETWRMDIWRVGGPRAAEAERTPTQLIASTRMDLHPSYSPDGQQIAFLSARSGAPEIWVCAGDGSKPRQLTFLDSALAGNPRWSPDGRTIAFFSTKRGSYDVWVADVSSGVSRPLTTGPAREIDSSWSRDGRWVYFCSDLSGRDEVWKVPAEGGDAVQVTTQGGCGAFESPDGRALYFDKGGFGGPRGIWRMPGDGGAEVKVVDWASHQFWAVLEQGILGFDVPSEGTGRALLKLFDVETGRSHTLAELGNVTAFGIAASPDGHWVLYAGGEQESDIMLVEDFR
jgi:Tol biopolymer transport system component